LRKVIITGCNGFIGSNLCKIFRKSGDRVIGLYRTKGLNNNENDYEFDLLNQNIAAFLETQKPDVIIHSAGSASVPASVIDPYKDYKLNVEMLYRVLTAIKEAGLKNVKFIYLSSAAVYGNPDFMPVNENFILNPISPYGLHKKLGEDICNYFKFNNGLDINIVRIFSAYGEGLRKQIFWDMANMIKKYGKIELFGTGNETRDFIHIDDVVNAIRCLVTSNTNESNLFNLANGISMRIRDIANIFAKKFNLNEELVFFNGIQKQGDPLNWQADIKRIESIGFKTQVNIEEGISRYANWIRSLENE
jgi:nucleoside-diphosphate-sugar epimerase